VPIDLDRLTSRLNPAVAWILRSPLHGLLSRGLMLITVTGRRSGRRYQIPVGYQRAGGSITVLISKPRRKRWWRNYRSAGPVELLVRGERLRGVARVVAGDTPEFRNAIEATLHRMPWLARQFGVVYQRGHGLGDAQWQTVAGQAAVVRIALDAD
jgi:deazaflavin-dependent oxidoreductase (nitroreductase family)